MTKLLTAYQPLLTRTALVSVALAGFTLLYLAARSFAGDYGVIGLSDDTIRAIAHFTVYGSLALVLAKALFNQFLLCWSISIALATGEEIHQLFVAYRFASTGDWMINLAGISVFLLAGHLLCRPRSCLS